MYKSIVNVFFVIEVLRLDSAKLVMKLSQLSHLNFECKFLSYFSAEEDKEAPKQDAIAETENVGSPEEYGKTRDLFMIPLLQIFDT